MGEGEEVGGARRVDTLKVKGLGKELWCISMFPMDLVHFGIPLCSFILAK